MLQLSVEKDRLEDILEDLETNDTKTKGTAGAKKRRKEKEENLQKEKKEFMVIPLREGNRRPKEPDFDDPIIRRVWGMQVEATDLADKVLGDYSIFASIIQLCQAFIDSKTK